jgi:hypothetical protein
LKAIAALLAKTIHRRTLTSRGRKDDLQSHAGSSAILWMMPNVKPTSANGKANTVWLNFTSDK